MASEPSKIKAIWEVRERITEALRHDGYVYKYDISLPLPKIYDVVEDSGLRCGGQGPGGRCRRRQDFGDGGGDRDCDIGGSAEAENGGDTAIVHKSDASLCGHCLQGLPPFWRSACHICRSAGRLFYFIF